MIHPDDIGVARQMVPSLRVFRREDLDDTWLKISYGDSQFRMKSTIWYEVEHEGFDIGDFVEVQSRMGKADPFIGRIREMTWNPRRHFIQYFLDRNDTTQARAYRAADLALLDSVDPSQPSKAGNLLRENTWHRLDANAELDADSTDD